MKKLNVSLWHLEDVDFVFVYIRLTLNAWTEWRLYAIGETLLGCGRRLKL